MVTAPYVISNQDPSLLQQCSQMLKRVFIPSWAIRRAEVYITANWGNTGLIGLDKHYEFHKHINTLEGNTLPIKAQDFYVEVCVTPIEYKTNLVLKIIELVLKKIFFFIQKEKSLAFPYMPSPLFDGARENDMISYQMDGQPVQLVLKQQAPYNKKYHCNFEEAYKALKASVELNTITQASPLYLFKKEDMPADVLYLESRVLGTNAVVSLKGNALQPVTAENIESLKKCFALPRTPCTLYTSELSFQIKFEAPTTEVKDICYLIDDNYFLMSVYKSGLAEYLSKASNSTCKHHAGTPQLETALELRTPKTIDPSKTKIALSENGLALITLFFKDSPQE